MKPRQHLLLSLLVFCCLLAAPGRASAWSSYIQGSYAQNYYAQDAQQTAPTAEQKKQDDKNKNKDTNKNTDARKTPPPNANQPTNAQPNDAPKPLFGGQVNLKSSRQSKDTATLGFNGLDPNGQVQKGFLAAAPTAADVAKAQQLTRTSVNQAELTAFMQEGGLNAPGGQQ
jgi:hypothetical protein